MRAYTACEIQQIIDEVWVRAFEAARNLHYQAPLPDPPSVHQVVDHPFTSSNAPGQYKVPWLTDPRGRRGLVLSVASLQMKRTK